MHQLHQPGGEIGAEKAAQAVHSGGDRRHVICSGGWDNRKPMAIVIGHQHFVSEPADGTDHQRRGLAGEPDQQQQSDPRDGIAEDHSHQGLSGIVKSRNFVSVLGIFVQIRDVGDAHGIYDALADAYESSCEADIQGIICCCAEDGANAEDDSGRDEDRLLVKPSRQERGDQRSGDQYQHGAGNDVVDGARMVRIVAIDHADDRSNGQVCHDGQGGEKDGDKGQGSLGFTDCFCHNHSSFVMLFEEFIPDCSGFWNTDTLHR